MMHPDFEILVPKVAAERDLAEPSELHLQSAILERIGNGGLL
jgi:hypothetical protein